MLVLENTATNELCYSFMGERLTFGIDLPILPRQNRADQHEQDHPWGMTRRFAYPCKEHSEYSAESYRSSAVIGVLTYEDCFGRNFRTSIRV